MSSGFHFFVYFVLKISDEESLDSGTIITRNTSYACALNGIRECDFHGPATLGTLFITMC